ncbi:hypothetical protein CHE218_27180 [Microbacterium sp. che218]
MPVLLPIWNSVVSKRMGRVSQIARYVNTPGNAIPSGGVHSLPIVGSVAEGLGEYSGAFCRFRPTALSAVDAKGNPIRGLPPKMW